MALCVPDPAPLLVRPVRAEDLPAVLAVERASFPVPWTERMFAGELRNPWSHFWVAERDGAVRAFALFWITLDEVHLLNLAVEPAMRRRGFARHLLERLLAFAEERAASHVLLEVRPSNHGAIRLYRAFGFRPMMVRPRYYSDNGEDAIVMLRPLGR
jgi:ribosomal-protein-alanine N-acetyltransferase